MKSSASDRDIADRLSTFRLHCPQNLERSFPNICSQSAGHGDATRTFFNGLLKRISTPLECGGLPPLYRPLFLKHLTYKTAAAR